MNQGQPLTPETVVAVEAIAHTYPATRKVKPRRALDGVSFSVNRGEIVGLLGPNGGGKSTLLKILSTALTPTEGAATILGLNVVSDRAALRTRIGVLFQSPSIDLKLTVFENLLYQGYLYGMHGATLTKRVHEMMQRLQLTEYAANLAESLSGGLQRRTEIAKTLLHSPEVLLLDEPSTGLDPAVRRDFWDVLRALRTDSSMTILVTTHIMDEAEACDRLVMIDRGRIVAKGTPAELKATIGGDVISLTCVSPDTLAQSIAAKFQLSPKVVDGTIRMELDRGHEFVPRLVEAFPNEISSISVSKPTLEDVFVQYAGRKFAAIETEVTA